MFEQLTKDLDDAREAMLEVGKAAIKPAILEFMEAHPEVNRIRVKMGTPSFNDGDPCLFTIDEPEVELVAGDLDATEADPDDDEEDDDDDWDDEEDGDFLDTYSIPPELPSREQLIADIESLHGVLQSADDAVRALFGDGVEVTVGRDGIARVDSYDYE
jgi:hypothetical protein